MLRSYSSKSLLKLTNSFKSLKIKNLKGDKSQSLSQTNPSQINTSSQALEANHRNGLPCKSYKRRAARRRAKVLGKLSTLSLKK